MKKVLVIVIAALIVSLVAGMHVMAAVPKPSVPEFTIKYVDNSYDYYVPPTYSVDPYTGNNVTSVVGQNIHMENKSIEVMIKTQPFVPYIDLDGNNVSLYYNVRSKGHYGNNWNNYRSFVEGYPASNSDYTVLTFELGSDWLGSNSYNGKIGEIPDGSLIDFQIEALIGYYNESLVPIYPGHALSPMTAVFTFNGETSDWSNTQTITIPVASASPSASPTSTSTPTSSPSSSESPAITSSPFPIQ